MTTSKTESLRLFFALWPDDKTRTALMQLQAQMEGKIVPYGNLHLTLSFLGQQAATLLPILKEMLMHLSSPAATLTLDRAGYFPRKRIAWIGTHDSPQELFLLQQELMQGLVRHNILPAHENNFKPHITLAREASLPPDMTFTPIVWRAHQVALVQSTMSAEGSKYAVLASRSLDEKCLLQNLRNTVRSSKEAG
jgi:2'-5' RNA ligase